MTNYDFLLDDHHIPSLNHINHSSDSHLKFALQIRRDECHDLPK
jgi:hypothetical protein